jgi:hypothetical protein
VDLSTLANVATSLTVLAAVAFGLLETHRARQERAERAAFAAVQAILTPEWMKSMILVHSIPDGSTPSAIEADARVLAAVQAVGVILEGAWLFGLCAHCSFECSRGLDGRNCSVGLA